MLYVTLSSSLNESDNIMYMAIEGASLSLLIVIRNHIQIFLTIAHIPLFLTITCVTVTPDEFAKVHKEEKSKYWRVADEK